jgi:hypothetical protein
VAGAPPPQTKHHVVLSDLHKHIVDAYGHTQCTTAE